MKKIKIIFLAFIGILFTTVFSSCSRRYIYAPEKPNIPFFKQKGETSVSADIGAYSLNFQGARAISDHLAATATGNLDIGLEKRNMVTTDGMGDTLSVVGYRRNNFTLGLGTFVLVNAKKNISLNLYVGAGGGNVNIFENYQDSSYNRYYNVNTSRFFFQPSVNFMFDSIINLAIYFKTTYVHYGKFSANYTPDERIYYGFTRIHNRMILYPEFGYDIQAKIPYISWIYFENSVTIAFRTRGLSGTFLYPHYANISFGLTVHF